MNVTSLDIDLKYLLSLPNYLMNDAIHAIDFDDLVEWFQLISNKDFLFLYYRLLVENRSSILLNRKLKNVVFAAEEKFNFLTRMDVPLIFKFSTSVQGIIDEFYRIKTQRYFSNFVAIELNDSKFFGIVTVASLILNNVISNKLDHLIQVCPTVKIDHAYSWYDRCVSDNNELLIGINYVMIIDSSCRAIGVVDLDYVLRSYDIYVDHITGVYYARKKRDLLYLGVAVIANTISTAVSCWIASMLSMQLDDVIVVSMVRCINDSIILVNLDNEIDRKSLSVAVFKLLSLLVSTLVLLLIILNRFYVAFSLFVHIISICSLVIFVISSCVNIENRLLRVSLLLVLPEIVTVLFSYCIGTILKAFSAILLEFTKQCLFSL